MYEFKFELAFLKMNGDEFQDLFSTVMEKRYPGDFQRVRPWGSQGDRKNDGYRRSTRTLYAVYAPETVRATRMIAKIDSDFRGALPHWEEYFSTWVFVHNQAGLPAPVLQKLLALGSEHGEVEFTQFGFEELRTEVFQLDQHNLAALFGPALSQRDMLTVGAAELRTLLDLIAVGRTPNPAEVKPVPPGKVVYNRLSTFVDTLLQAGRIRVPLVENVLAHHIDPAVGEKIASGFRERYRVARDAGLSPDEVFAELQEYVGGALRGTTREQAAGLTVLAYYFDACEIFERPEESGA